VYDNKKENWKILTNKEIYALVKNPLLQRQYGYRDYVGLGMYR